ncbi:MAG: MotA/TolQ/ExbB proton channel family protein [Sphingomonadales bacterium]|nr:MotA/TolQ/ExbB proton channel family protein [Sphingomonadales bacterium]
MKFSVKHILVAAFTVSAGILNAQVAQTNTEESFKTVEEISVIDFLMKGGVFLIPIALLLFYTTYIAVERYLYIRRMTKQDMLLLNDLQTQLNAGNMQGALDVTNRDQTAFGSVVKEGVQSIGRPVPQIEANMEKVANIEIGKMEKNVNHLGLIAGIAPTLGFIGTISGVIKIFYNISISENVSIGNISGGLYEKMISSGSGLVVGILAFTAYHILNGIIDNYALAIQKINLEFVKLIRPKDGNKA